MALIGLRVDPTDSAPIWRQIEQGVARLVAAGTLASGTPVPSVRDLAKDLRVNPATVSKAYQRLVDAGLLQVRRGEGTFVADDPPASTKAERKQTLKEAAMRYAVIATTVAATEDSATEAIRSALAELRSPEKGKR